MIGQRHRNDVGRCVLMAHRGVIVLGRLRGMRTMALIHLDV
jgi:hypothetical protein